MKIALINSMFFDKGTNIHYVNTYNKTSDYFFKTAKKYFLKKHDVDFLTITNIDNHINNKDVQVIKVDYPIDGLYHALTMKVLCLEFVKKEYDYIFVADADQIFVNEVNDEDILNDDYVFLRHFYRPKFNGILSECTDYLTINFDGENVEWTMGNFFGGKKKVMEELLKFSKKIHEENFPKNISKNYEYYCKYAEEFFVGAFPHEKNVSYKTLSSITNPYEDLNNDYFLSDFIDDNKEQTLYQNIKNVKILHNTKKNLEQLDRVIKFFI
jgi:hypothetical protein